MKKIVLVGIFFSVYAAEPPPKKTFFPQLLEGFINKSRCSPAGKYYVSQAACLKLHDPLHFHFALHNVATRVLLFEKKLTVAHLYKFSRKDSYLAISPDGITLEIVRPATGEITHYFTMGYYTNPENFDFCEDERFVRYWWLNRTQIFDLVQNKKIGKIDRYLNTQTFIVQLEKKIIGIITKQSDGSRVFNYHSLEQ